MNTMLVSLSRSGREYIWLRISVALKFPSKPCLPVWQKRQFILQPICEDTQSVARSSSGIYTVSTNFPLSVGNKYLIVPSLEGESIEDYSMQVAEKWKLGDKEKDSGALLLVAVKDKKLRVEVGYGLEENLTDSRSGQIIRNFITPQFRSGNYGEGIYDGIKAMAAYASEDESLLKEIAVSDEDDEGGFPHILLFLIFAYLMISKFSPHGIFWIFYLLSRNSRAGRSFSGRSSSRSSFFSGSTGSSSGRGFSGGGFSGGGGSFGGGGASGGW